MTRLFNLGLFLYLCFAAAVDFLFDPQSEMKVPWDKVYEWSPAAGITIAIGMLAILVLWGAALVRIFWNRFISDLFKIRNITYDESLALVLVMALFLI